MVKAAVSDIGRHRDKNQDGYYLSDESEDPIYIVADGMGGHKCGEIASSMALDSVIKRFKDNKEPLSNKDDILKLIKTSMEAANIKIYLKSLEMVECKGMGTTMTLAYIFKDKILIGHVGDSRAYIIRDKKIYQITEDHSYINELLKNGTITLQEAKEHPKKNMITRALGVSSIVEVDIIQKKYKKDDILLLCSDGLFNMLSEVEITGVFNEESSMVKCSQTLIDMANEKGGFDNITVIVVKLN